METMRRQQPLLNLLILCELGACQRRKEDAGRIPPTFPVRLGRTLMLLEEFKTYFPWQPDSRDNLR